MNIFATFSCPQKSAKYLDDKRVIKMILESAQMLSTSMYFYNKTGVYKATHMKHPCTLWVKNTRSNYEWLLNHFIYLAGEYNFRYGKRHSCLRFLDTFNKNMNILPKGSIEKFANCTTNKEFGINFKHIDDVHLAYRLYLGKRWENDKRPASCRFSITKEIKS